MKREDKNLKTRQKIISAAIEEFGDKSYAESSLNVICKEGKISKGIIYHYFNDKDELFLVCIKECFDALMSYLKTNVIIENKNVETVIRKYFDARITFFDENPLYLKLFCSAVLIPPAHLVSEIEKIREDFDALNISVLTTLLEKVPLRKDITIHEVIDEFRLYQDYINTRYQMQTIHQLDIEEHEKRCNRSLSILLYGVIEREDNDEK